MRIIPVGTLPKIFKQSITAEMLCAVVRRPSLLSRSPLTRPLLLLGATPARGPGADVPGVCATAQVSCLVEQYLGAHDLPLEAFKVMRALAKVNRMKTTLLSMTSAEKGQLTALFDQLENTGVDWKSAGARPGTPAPPPCLSMAWLLRTRFVFVRRGLRLSRAVACAGFTHTDVMEVRKAFGDPSTLSH